MGLFAPVVSLNFFAGGGWLDVHEYLFIPSIIGSLAFFSYSFLTLQSHIALRVLLNVSMVLSEILGIPNITWPLGSQWWDSISLGFGLSASILIAFNLLLFGLIHARKALIVKEGTSQT